MRRYLLALSLLAGCATGPVRPEARPAEVADAAPVQALVAFLAAVDGGRFDEAYGLVSGRWRARLTPDRLRDDLAEGGALAADRLERARRAVGGPVLRKGDRADLPIGEDRAVRLVHEASGWKIDALE